MPPIVSIQRCLSYDDRDALQAVVRASFDHLGGLESLVKPGDRVFCKVNLLVPATAAQSVTTHPEVLRAVLREVKRVGGVPLVGDNPAMNKPATVMKKAGILAVLEEEQVEAPDMAEWVEIPNPDALAFKTFAVSKAIVEADVLLNLPKLKTHALTYMTLAVKNLFGLIPGTEKARWHMKAQSPERFALCLCDLYGAVQRRFGARMVHLMDGVVAMEGDGPGTGGKARPTGAILASTDAVALDRVACALAGLDQARHVVVTEAVRRGLGEGDLDRIELVGEPLSTWAGQAFEPAPGTNFQNSLSTRLQGSPFLKNLLLDRPRLDPTKCKVCRRCGEICPASAISFPEDKAPPRFDLGACIRCYCCAEICPDGALRKSDPPLLGRFLGLGR